MRPSFPSRLSHFPWLLRNFQRCLNIVKFLHVLRTSLVAQMVNCVYNARDLGSIHSSTLALKIPWTEELGAGYCPWGHKESGMTEWLHFLSFFHFPCLKSNEKKAQFISHWTIAQQPHLKEKNTCRYQKNWELVSLITSIACHSALQKFSFSSPGRRSRRKTFLYR